MRALEHGKLLIFSGDYLRELPIRNRSPLLEATIDRVPDACVFTSRVWFQDFKIFFDYHLPATAAAATLRTDVTGRQLLRRPRTYRSHIQAR